MPNYFGCGRRLTSRVRPTAAGLLGAFLAGFNLRSRTVERRELPATGPEISPVLLPSLLGLLMEPARLCGTDGWPLASTPLY